jgi:hypothetical protein
MSTNRDNLVKELIDYFESQKFTVHGAKGVEGYEPPPMIANDGFGDLRPRYPDVVGMDKEKHRIVFGIVRESAGELDTEQALADYNVFLDHRQGAGREASLLIVLLPGSLVANFTNLLTHYIHREYWHRIITVVSKNGV